MIEEVTVYPAERSGVASPKLVRELRVQVVRDLLGYGGVKAAPGAVILGRDPPGAWRDEALVTTDPATSAGPVIAGYCPGGARSWRSSTAGGT
jgi:hypothetical protein